jgi:hypothetical protein
MHLGSRLYIDASGDLSNPEYMNHVVDQICHAAQLLDAGVVPPSSKTSSHPTPSTVFKLPPNTRSLESLNVKEVETLFDALSLGAFKSAVTANHLDGATLECCTTVEDLIAMGISLRPKAVLLLNKVNTFKVTGVPLDLLTSIIIPDPPNPDALLLAAKEGNLERIRKCLDNGTDIECKDSVSASQYCTTYTNDVIS